MYHYQQLFSDYAFALQPHSWIANEQQLWAASCLEYLRWDHRSSSDTATEDESQPVWALDRSPTESASWIDTPERSMMIDGRRTTL
jgi:hypothetical protein